MNMSLATHQHSASRARKRRRKVWACSECRRRKLQCDRLQPVCSRCVATGQQSSCTYQDEAPSGQQDGISLHAVSDTLTSAPVPCADVHLSDARSSATVHQLERRLQHLESMLTNRTHLFSTRYPVASNSTAGPSSIVIQQDGTGTTPPDPLEERFRRLESSLEEDVYRAPNQVHVASTSNQDDDPALNDREVYMPRKSSWKTEFYGFTSAGSMSMLIPELHEFARDALDRFPSITDIRHELSHTEIKALLTPNRSRFVVDRELRDMLPARPEADNLVQSYFDNLDCIYHVIYRSQFSSEYNRMWDNEATCNPEFVILVLLVVAIALCLQGSSLSTPFASSGSSRAKATTIIQSCEDWLQVRINMYDGLVNFQVGFLMLFAKQLNARRYKRTWANSGKLLRDFMHAGLHRDPDHLGANAPRIDEADKEMRKLLWTAAAEFELQASFEQGMCAMPWPQQSNVSMSSSDDDDTLEPDPSSAFSEVSYLTFASKTINLRHRINAMLNDGWRAPDFEKTRSLTDELDRGIEQIPEWTDARSMAPRALLLLSLHQYMLTLHVWQLRVSSTSSERRFSHMIILETAFKMISIHKTLLDHNNHALELLCGHNTRAALALCYASRTNPRGVLTTAIEGSVYQLSLIHI